MDMSVGEGPLLQRLFSAKGFTATSHYFVMDWVSICRTSLVACCSRAHSQHGCRPLTGASFFCRRIRC